MLTTLKRMLTDSKTTPAEPSVVASSPQAAPSKTEADFTLLDASLSGWFQIGTGELLTGFKVEPEDHVLDVGCGDGSFIHFCANRGAEVTFVDIDAERVRQTQQLLRDTPARGIHGLISDASPLPLPDNHVDKVVAMEVMEHVDQPAEFLAELVRVGKPGAQYLLSVPHITSETVQQHLAPAVYFEKPNHINIFSEDDFARLVRESGLIIEKQTNYGFFWSMFWAFFWTCNQDLNDPWHPLLQQWGRTWETLLAMPDGPRIKHALDQAMPKSQAIIARKPE